MEPTQRRTDIPVLMLHDIDPAWESSEKASAFGAVEKLKTELRNEGHPVIDVPLLDHALEEALQPFHPDDYVVFNWCEGLPGLPRSENVVAEILENLNFAYTGACSEVLAFSWDKAATKKLLLSKGIPTPAAMVVNEDNIEEWDRFPAIVKPTFEHCSLGITGDAVVMDKHELEHQVRFVNDNLQQPAMVEDFIDGREFHVTLWGNGTIHALPPAEMDFAAFKDIKDRVCTFDSKFTPGSSHYENIILRIPAELDEEQLELLNRTAIRAYRAIGCRDYARVDIRMENGIYYVLDINPNSDFSPDTSSIYAAEISGLSYGAIASCLINLAARRHPVYSALV
ncbi:MAG: ATP-grasp domain-containing protein [Spirochaetes bacterium]|nr:ATP-grasp domain-containing protein [Spirochaetota bacterium]